MHRYSQVRIKQDHIKQVRIFAILIVCLGLIVSACGTSSDGETETSTLGGVTVDEPVKAGSLAKDLPNEVPLVEGQISESYALESNGTRTWTVEIAIADLESSFDSGGKLLTEAGFTKGFASFDESGGASIWENETYNVIFNTNKNDSRENMAGYLVSTLAGEGP